MASTASGEICLGKRQRIAKEEANRVFAPKKGKESCSHLTVDRIRSVDAAVLHRSVAWLAASSRCLGLATRTVGKEIWGILLAPSCLPSSFGLRGYSSLLYVDCLRGFGWASADGKESWRILLAPLCSPNSFGLRGCSSALCVLACHGCAWLVGLGWASSTKGKENWGILLASLCSPICSVYAAVVLFSVSSILEVLSWGWVFWAGRQALAKKVEESCSHLHVRRFRSVYAAVLHLGVLSCGLGGKYGRQGRVEGKKGRQSDVCSFRLVYRSFVDSLICLFVQIAARKTYLKTQETGRVEDR